MKKYNFKIDDLDMITLKTISRVACRCGLPYYKMARIIMKKAPMDKGVYWNRDILLLQYAQNIEHYLFKKDQANNKSIRWVW